MLSTPKDASPALPGVWSSPGADPATVALFSVDPAGHPRGAGAAAVDDLGQGAT